MLKTDPSMQTISVRPNLDDRSWGVITNIMSSQVYSNLPAALLREYATNSADAVRRVGLDLAEHPVRVDIPCPENQMVLTVSDDGEGMDLATITENFAGIGNSLKSDDQHAVGQMGIGATCGWALSDQITVNTVRDGRHLVVVVDKGTDGIREAVVLLDEATEAPSGTAVKVAVGNEYDFYRWGREAAQVYRWWPQDHVHLTRGGTTLEVDPVHLVELSQRHAMLPHQQYPQPAVAVMGSIAYPLPVDEIAPDLDWDRLKTSLVVLLDNKEMVPAASREQLQLDETSRQVLAVDLQLAHQLAVAHAQQQADAAENLEALKRLHHTSPVELSTLSWRGIPLADVEVPVSSLFKVVRSNSTAKTSSRGSYGTNTFKFGDNLVELAVVQAGTASTEQVRRLLVAHLNTLPREELNLITPRYGHSNVIVCEAGLPGWLSIGDATRTWTLAELKASATARAAEARAKKAALPAEVVEAEQKKRTVARNSLPTLSTACIHGHEAPWDLTGHNRKEVPLVYTAEKGRFHGRWSVYYRQMPALPQRRRIVIGTNQQLRSAELKMQEYGVTAVQLSYSSPWKAEWPHADKVLRRWCSSDWLEANAAEVISLAHALAPVLDQLADRRLVALLEAVMRTWPWEAGNHDLLDLHANDPGEEPLAKVVASNPVWLAVGHPWIRRGDGRLRQNTERPARRRESMDKLIAELNSRRTTRLR